MRLGWVAGVCLGMSVAAVAQAPQSKTDAELRAEYDKAQKLYEASNFVAALPLFEDLYAQQPKSLVYEERLAMSLLGAAGNMAPDAGKAAHARAKRLLLDAKSKGDDSQLLTTLLEKMGDGDGSSAMPAAPLTPAQTDFAAAEKLFGAGDIKAALVLYEKALEEDPTYYVAALYAGDALFKTGDCAQAGVYYAKAVAIDPDHETAYRYWADCLMKQGERTKARDMYINAVIAQPYSKTTRQSLQAWAETNHARIVPPPITLPNRAAPGKNGNITITLDANKTNDPESGLAMMYSMNSALWQGEKFKKTYPNEKVYRHSLAEEMDSITGMLTVARETKIPEGKLSASTKSLMEIQKDNMLECYILLDNPDQGVAQDFVAYRAGHRELMRKYVEKYDIHPM
jgi:tetratricopeptide (TPR) repeat protein